jgi:hypothetical protein
LFTFGVDELFIVVGPLLVSEKRKACISFICLEKVGMDHLKPMFVLCFRSAVFEVWLEAPLVVRQNSISLCCLFSDGYGTVLLT